MKETLKRFCSSLNIECIGIAPIGPYTELESIFQNRAAGEPFAESDIQIRINPRLTMDNVQSIIVCLFPYYIGSNSKANIAKYTYAYDYHHIIKEKLDQIGAFLQANIPNFTYQAYTDTGPLVDRYLAYLAGLGFYGINGHIITDAYGSYVLIGYMLTNYPFEPDKPDNRTCTKCGRCMAACPGQVILGNFHIDPRYCRSYLTQKKGELTTKEQQIIKKSGLIFGCDICQDVCPHNHDAAPTNIEEFKKDILFNVDCTELSSLSNKEFSKKYGNRAFSWRGKQILIRNDNILKE